jgi:hypothetical protein
MSARGISIVLAMAVAGVVAAACSSVPDSHIGVVAPDRAQFPPVANVLDHACGSLDCHGNAQRNFVIWGCEGLRLDPASVPGCRRMGGTDTTDPEFDATYRSLVGLEPALMSSVVQNGGADPEELTFVRKARGEEQHTGGTVIPAGSDGDHCIASWLAGTTDQDACAAAMKELP